MKFKERIFIGYSCFKLGRTGDEGDDRQLSEEMVGRVGKQRMPADVVRRHIIINKVGPKGIHPKCLHTNKEVLIELGKLSHFFCKIITVGCSSELPVHKHMHQEEQTEDI